jgi:ribosomal protein S18 acetylase RimI-like enzyme
MDSVTIRRASAADADAIVTLVRGLADFEHLPGPDAAGAARLRRDLTDPARIFDVLVAESAGTLVGYALFFLTYSTFRARRKLFLEDLFVAPAYRNRAVGRALLLACARVAAQRDCCQLEWTVLHWNAAAQRFYRRLGGERDVGWQIFTLDEAGLGGLAEADWPDGIGADAL